jgi:hypothetical protein
MFTFEHTHQLSEAEYRAIWALHNPARGAQLVRRLGVVLVGVACLFSAYTILLGVVILGLATVISFLPHVLPGTMARTFRQLRYLKGPVAYGADGDGVWVRTPDFLAKASWAHVTVWRERAGWLVLQGNGFPPVLLPIATLKDQGLYGQVKLKAEQHGVEFGSAAAARRLAI